MAKSPAHRFGQIIGDMLESAIEPRLQEFAASHNLYLDKRGPRPARGKNTKVVWIDSYDNAHDLDFVLERNGSPEEIGTPVAFIELAWRRYTKHSRNKAQEIQGAITPLVARYSHAAPFTGVILAGVWTEGALSQLESLNFNLLYFEYRTVIDAFGAVGIDANFDELTPDTAFESRVRAWDKLSRSKRDMVMHTLLAQNTDKFDAFMSALLRAVTREIEFIRILPLYGSAVSWQTAEDAIVFIQTFAESEPVIHDFVRYEIEIRFNNNVKIQASFADKHDAVEFLREYQVMLPHPGN